jgi:hypothetical protein
MFAHDPEWRDFQYSGGGFRQLLSLFHANAAHVPKSPVFQCSTGVGHQLLAAFRANSAAVPEWRVSRGALAVSANACCFSRPLGPRRQQAWELTNVSI